MKVVIYSNGKDSKEFKVQKNVLASFAKDKNWEICNSSDTDSSYDHPVFHRLLEDAKNQKFEAILCKPKKIDFTEIEQDHSLISLFQTIF